jgi:hypothetical protein
LLDSEGLNLPLAPAVHGFLFPCVFVKSKIRVEPSRDNVDMSIWYSRVRYRMKVVSEASRIPFLRGDASVFTNNLPGEFQPPSEVSV